MAKLVDAPGLGPDGSNTVPVRVRPRAPLNPLMKGSLMFFRKSKAENFFSQTPVEQDKSTVTYETMQDSAEVLKAGCEVQEYDTVPAELLELFK